MRVRIVFDGHYVFRRCKRDRRNQSGNRLFLKTHALQVAAETALSYYRRITSERNESTTVLPSAYGRCKFSVTKRTVSLSLSPSESDLLLFGSCGSCGMTRVRTFPAICIISTLCLMRPDVLQSEQPDEVCTFPRDVTYNAQSNLDCSRQRLSPKQGIPTSKSK